MSCQCNKDVVPLINTYSKFVTTTLVMPEGHGNLYECLLKEFADLSSLLRKHASDRHTAEKANDDHSVEKCVKKLQDEAAKTLAEISDFKSQLTILSEQLKIYKQEQDNLLKTILAEKEDLTAELLEKAKEHEN